MEQDLFEGFTPLYPHRDGSAPPAQFSRISRCFVRKDHTCGKLVSVSKSCFIACPSTEDVGTLVALITEKLTQIGIEPVVAVKERAYGQDIFCTKICGRIIESQFCIVILDDTIGYADGAKINIPIPNVYYEYGLMTALGKHVIPLQKQDQSLAFNIQTHDTIKYGPGNISAELDRALKDAVRMSTEFGTTETKGPVSRRFLGRCLEMNGYQRKDTTWFLHSDLADTVFEGYGHPERKEYLFFAVAYEREVLRDLLTDMQVIIKRMESRCNDLDRTIEALTQTIEAVKEESGEGRLRPLQRSRLNSEISKRADSISKLELIQNARFAVVLAPDLTELKAKILEQYECMHDDILHLPVFVGDLSRLDLDELSISFEYPTI